MTMVLLLCIMQVFAQEKTVTGKVTEEDGNPIPNASIQVKGSSVGTVTNGSGDFTLSIPGSAKTLVISAIGKATQEVSIGSTSNFAIKLAANTGELSEVVVVGYGSGKKKENVAGSLTKLSGDVVESKPTANMIDALQGRVGGLQVYNGSGEPSSTPTVRLHGVGSLGASNTPLYVLDGIPVGSGS
ncbi:MAG TPA: carboxypeptidase-like regulatory domain-containing protein, partial [Lacibacter sp.]|nr:carboxypeptidase-like regulatory domain-containing protein [Lacibacter sp.]